VSCAHFTAAEPALSETCLKWQRRSKVPPNVRCVPSHDFSMQKVNAQRKFTNKLLLFMVMLWTGKMWQSGAMNSGKKFNDDDVVQRAGGRFLWLGDTEAGSKT